MKVGKYFPVIPRLLVHEIRACCSPNLPRKKYTYSYGFKKPSKHIRPQKEKPLPRNSAGAFCFVYYERKPIKRYIPINQNTINKNTASLPTSLSSRLRESLLSS